MTSDPPLDKICGGQEVELADKTVRAKDNNEKLHAALQAKAKQAEQMMVMNQGLIFENRSLRNDLDLAEASEVQTNSYLGTFEPVRRRCMHGRRVWHAASR